MNRRFARTDYYRLLQVDPAAHPEIIRAAYRTLLRTLRRHPDLGGDEAEARTIIEAYGTLIDPEGRRAYDLWLAAHSAPPQVPAAPAPSIGNWLRNSLPRFQLSPRAPFAKAFDYVFVGTGLRAPRLYVKTYAEMTRLTWPTVFVLCRAVGVARHGLMPSTDVVLLVAEQVEALDRFLADARRHSAQWAWNRLLIAVLTLAPARLHTTPIVLMPPVLKRLREALSTDLREGRIPFLA